MLARRTDLALEARELWQESAAKTTELSGVRAREYRRGGCAVTHVEILDEQGAQALGKPCGRYVTVELTGFARHDEQVFESAVNAVAEELRAMLPIEEGEGALVVGLGNREITPDAVGTHAVANTMVTNHLVERMPEMFGALRQVAAITPGVLGTTGIESAEIIRAVAERIKPACVIAVDALASRSLSRLCTTVQIADTGIVPGSGVGNARALIDRETLGVPVIALGVPTVVDAGTLALDLMEKAGISGADGEMFEDSSLMVTPREIDTHVAEIAKVIGYAINLCMHRGITIADVTGFLS